jgi:hypothetical protein
MKHLVLFAIATVAFAQPPVIPVGMDAYRQWDRWPYQRIGARAYMRSTYERAGGNERADASHFLYQDWHGSAWANAWLILTLFFIATDASSQTRSPAQMHAPFAER